MVVVVVVVVTSIEMISSGCNSSNIRVQINLVNLKIKNTLSYTSSCAKCYLTCTFCVI